MSILTSKMEGCKSILHLSLRAASNAGETYFVHSIYIKLTTGEQLGNVVEVSPIGRVMQPDSLHRRHAVSQQFAPKLRHCGQSDDLRPAHADVSAAEKEKKNDSVHDGRLIVSADLELF